MAMKELTKSGGSARQVDYGPMLTTSGAGWTVGELQIDEQENRTGRLPFDGSDLKGDKPKRP